MSVNDLVAWLKTEWPHPPDHVLARLRHTLDVYDSDLLDARPPDRAMAIPATASIYYDEHGKRVDTGITWGDLRLIRAYLERMWEIEGERPMAPLLSIPLDNFGPGKRPTIR